MRMRPRLFSCPVSRPIASAALYYIMLHAALSVPVIRPAARDALKHVQFDDSTTRGGTPPSEKDHQFFGKWKIQDRQEMAIQYLTEFGYLRKGTAVSHRDLTNAIRAFQDMVKLRQTGQLDSNTLAYMMQPRCGNEDLGRRSVSVYGKGRTKRFENKVRDGGVLKLKWFIENYTADMPREDIRKAVKRAFHLWSSQVPINAMESLKLIFEEANSEADADITILWAEGDHGDAHKFDGPGLDGSNILAHTFYPNYQAKGTLNGDIHLDDYELWTLNGTRDGASFFHVLIHEIGHTLGLGHSKKQQAIMYPIYRKENTDLTQLDLDDKCAVNWSYVGASDYCLYIWLLSEVLPKKMAMEKEQQQHLQQQSSASAYLASSSDISEPPPTPIARDVSSTRVRLRKAKVLLCKPDNQVQAHIARMLRHRLDFPRNLADAYSEIVCGFFEGIHREYGTMISESFHDVMRIHGSHAYFQRDVTRFERLQRALEEDSVRRTFDAQFFNSPAFQYILYALDT